jgi:hypothetical protein
VNGQRLRQVIADDPLLGDDLDVHRYDDDGLTSDPEQLADSLLDVVPVMQRQHRHRRIDRPIAERERLRGSANRRSGMRRALSDHHLGGLDCDDLPIVGLVGPDTRAHVDDARRAAERCPDRRRDTTIGSPDLVVAAAHGVVAVHDTSVPGKLEHGLDRNVV